MTKESSSADRNWPIGKVAGVLVLLLIVVIGGLGAYWSWQPEWFEITDLEMTNPDIDTKEALKTPGVATVSTTIKLAETLLDKPGGYLSNDLMPPGVLMDNMPSWEYGVLQEVRDSARALRNEFSRSQTQSVESDLVKTADVKFSFDAHSYMLPSTEGEYRAGIKTLQRFRAALIAGNDQTARFFVRADNLRAYLQVVEKRLGSYAQRLSASVGDAELVAAFVDPTQAQVLEKTSWYEIDNNFYEARGYAWALLHMMQAISHDFAEVLEGKNAHVSLEQIIRDLHGATLRKMSPVVLNGHGYGLLANHSLVLASYLSRANAAVIDLRVLMERG
ncbi:DUF2333 family protein [Rhabdochromatium marinum]|uniref:DUF2333 family protein n=1 Tax=Rhabdochromatium marinum TaxID=48729 RepID=UPI00308442A8